MKRDLIRLPILDSSFLSCEKDCETILRKLFIQSKPYSDELKRMLIINSKDCLDNKDNCIYSDISMRMTVPLMRMLGYIRLEPVITIPNFYKITEEDLTDSEKCFLDEYKNIFMDKRKNEIKSYIVISFDNFIPNPTNPQFRDCNINFDILCHNDCWDIGNYRLRPLKICGYIDGLLNNTKLSGIGTFQFAGCNQLILSEDISGYSLTYKAIHGTDDRIEDDE